ncbi:MAG TPA: tRNA preQ1(34) S-adenosylmethionine ribosyltransferase-isomerase QueA [Tepidisphaeraceae bacterium]|jgi:S-adenosylmethionine:tRNA ribosyltransferase-isomerase|nr:tRNA preQ1(34) S-adenosylmethionine ribosyltransferase-isomerase QueA [Tepidisphaeraceae bacterium]
MRSDELDFHLPPELIAQEPAGERTASRLLHYRRPDRSIAHRTFSDLPSLLRAGDLLVFNDARVIPARFTLRKSTGGRIEGLFVSEDTPGQWQVMLRNLGPITDPVPLTFADEPTLTAQAVGRMVDGNYVLRVDTTDRATDVLDRLGRMPLPPYIRRDKDHDARDAADRERYQTVFANRATAVAAPTAALHFTPELLAELDARGVQRACVTLDVGLGTFKPLSSDTLEAHAMHRETYAISPQAAVAINLAKQERRRVIAVGTTSARVLESQPSGQPIQPVSGSTAIFIYPPYEWRYVDAMVTNFHLPRSTLIALVAAMVGLDEQRRIYATAIAERYRFFSYGDSMLVE